MNKGQTERAACHKRLSSIVLSGSDAVVTAAAENSGKTGKGAWLAETSDEE